LEKWLLNSVYKEYFIKKLIIRQKEYYKTNISKKEHKGGAKKQK